MADILIVEGNSPELTARGYRWSDGFVSTFATLAPNVTTRVAEPHRSPLTPDDTDGVTGIIFSGSGVAWSPGDAEAAPQRQAMELAMESGLPIWGSCNGMQLAMVVLGGTCRPSPNGREAGLACDLQLTEAGRAHPCFAMRHQGYAVPCIHRDELASLPSGAKILAGNAHTEIQGVAFEADGIRFCGVQYHPELKASDIAYHLSESNVFADHRGLLEDLDRAEKDPEAAARLGASPVDLTPAIRAQELLNWLDLIGVGQSPAMRDLGHLGSPLPFV